MMSTPGELHIAPVYASTEYDLSIPIPTSPQERCIAHKRDTVKMGGVVGSDGRVIDLTMGERSARRRAAGKASVGTVVLRGENARGKAAISRGGG